MLPLLSAKDYILDVHPLETGPHSVVRFTVRPQPGVFQKHLRGPLMGILAAVLASYTIFICRQWSLAIDFVRHIRHEAPTRGFPTNGSFPPVLEALFGHAFPEKLEWTTYGSLIRSVAVILVLAAALFVVYCRQDAHESILVIKDVGIQLNSRPRWKFLATSDSDSFIPLANIMDLVIHEGFHGYGQVIFYMCILLQRKENDGETDEDAIKVVFPGLLPRKDLLLRVWTQSRTVLFGDTRRYWRRVPGHGLKECI